MLAGMVVSAVMGGLVGVFYAMAQDQGLVQALISYQIGGTIAVLSYLASVQSVSSRRD